MKIFGFYFIALLNDYYTLVNNQLNTLFESELFDKTDTLYVYIYDPNNNINTINGFFNNKKKIKIIKSDINNYEFDILKLIHNLSFRDNFLCYYFHTKGVSINQTNFSFYKVDNFKQLKENVDSWRKYMEYFLISLYDKNIKYLNEGYDTVGVQLTNTPNTQFKHYSGNFWWSKSEYIKKLPKIESLRLNHRWDAEFWIGYGDGKMKNLFSTSQAGYRQQVKIDYKSESLNL